MEAVGCVAVELCWIILRGFEYAQGTGCMKQCLNSNLCTMPFFNITILKNGIMHAGTICRSIHAP